METQTLQKQSTPKTAKPNVPFFAPAIQKKLSVGASNDSYEAEADTVADKVMRMTEPQQRNVSHSGSLVQRKCAACEQEEKLRMKPLAESISSLIQKSPTENSGESQASSHVENQINSSKGGGSVMDHSTKSFMESRFGTDFSGVRIHTGSQAVQMSRELNAQAFTVGNDVYFNEGKYSPNSDSGKHLLAHELTHTVQQGGGIDRKVQRQEELCMPASSWFSMAGVPAPWLTSSAFGFLIEKLVEVDYCSTVGCSPLNIYFDDLSPTNYVNFLIRKNPHLAADRRALWLVAATGLNRPDIIDDNGLSSRQFYEIKPRSISGLEAGIAKLLVLQAFYDVYSIPYSYGTSYSPTNKKILSTIVNAGPWPVEISIRVSKIAPGLIAYDICVEGELAKIAAVALLAAIVAALIIFQPELAPILAPVLAQSDTNTGDNSEREVLV
jgi:hypothetical protein